MTSTTTRTAVFLRTLLLLSLVILLPLVTGCGGGGGGSKGPAPVSSGDSTAIFNRLQAFMTTATQKNSAAAEQYISDSYRAQSGQNALSALEVIDFGLDPLDPTDNGTFTFTIPTGGITRYSADQAEVFAYLDTPLGNRINLTFQMIQLEGVWFINDFTLTTEYRGTQDLAAYFPLHEGDYWKYLEYVNGTQTPYLAVRTVQANPETLNGRTVYTVQETFEPRSGSPTTAPSGGRFATYGGKHRFSNSSGLWDYGPPAGNTTYVLNSGNPVALGPTKVGIGSTTYQGALQETLNGVTYTSLAEFRFGQMSTYNDRMGNFQALPLVISQQYSGTQTSPFHTSTTHTQRYWYLKDGLGMVAYFVDDRNTGLPLQEGWLVEARVYGQLFRPTSWPYSILDAGLLPDSTVGQPFTKAFNVRWGAPPYSWNVVSGTVPPGLTLAGTGTLSGTLTQAGTFQFTLNVADDDGRVTTKAFTMTVKSGMAIIGDSNLATGQVTKAYQHVFKGENLPSDYTWNVASFTPLPPGLTLNPSSGVLSGSPITTGRSLIQIFLQDSSKKTRTYRTFELVIRPAVVGTMTPSRCLAWEGSSNLVVTLEFQDDRNQPVNIAGEALKTNMFLLHDRQNAKTGGAVTVKTASPEQVSLKDRTITLTFAKGSIDLRSTSVDLIASGVFSQAYTRVSGSTPTEPSNLGRFRAFHPWSDLRSDGGPVLPRKITANGLAATELVLVYPDVVRSFPLSFTQNGSSYTVTLDPANAVPWSSTNTAHEFMDMVLLPGQNAGYALGGPDLNPFVASLQRTDTGLRGWRLNANLSKVIASQPRFLGVWNPGLAGEVILVGDATYLLAYQLNTASSTLDQFSSFPAAPRGVSVGKQSIFTLKENGEVRSFKVSTSSGFSGGATVGTLPLSNITFPATPAPGTTIDWRQVGTDLTFDLTDPGTHSLLQYNLQTALVNGRARGGDASLTSIRGRLNKPFGYVHLNPWNARQFTIIADEDGLQIFEDRDAD